MTKAVHQNIEQKLSRLTETIESGSLFQLQGMINAMHPAEIAHVLESSPPSRRSIIWGLIDPENEGETLIEMGDEARANLIDEMESGELVEAVKDLNVDDIVDFLQSLPDELTKQTLAGMGRQQRERIQAALAYNEDTAGGMMDTEVITIRADVSVDVVLRYLRIQEELPSHTDTLIIISKYGKYRGILSLSTLLTSQPDEKIQDILDDQHPAIPADMPSNEVASLFENRDLISAPVVNHEGALLGRITIDDVVDVIRDEAEHSMMGMAGLNEEEDLFAPVINSSKRRALWLGTNLLTAFLASWVIKQFTDTLESAIALVALMSIVPSMGGIAGSQTLTLVIRGLALGQIVKGNTHSLLNKELLIGLINGLIWAAAVFIISVVIFHDTGIGIVVAIAMLLNLLIAPLTGVALPIILRKFGIDPALAGSVLLTTVTDVVGYAAVLGLAALFLPYIRTFFA
ncbi:MAG TPA: magnesium transporter [Leucothrix sp.]|nr:magnesium transporter [Leucothrix sp.]